jgi:hypothetical protein
MMFWAPNVDDMPSDFIDRHLNAVVAKHQAERGSNCAFDSDTVAWLESEARALRGSQPSEFTLTALGIALGQCFLERHGGEWHLITGQLDDARKLLVVRIAPNVYVVPWLKVTGYAEGDDADSFVGFFETATLYAKPHDTPQFVS